MPFFVYTVFYNINEVNKRIIMRIVKLTIFIMFFAVACANTYSQKCGDGILFSF